MKSRVVFRSDSDEWATPQELFDRLDAEFGFDLDPCASEYNHKCENYFSKEDDGLKQSWEGHRVFCNPPYSQMAKWVEKCYREGCKDNTLVLLLIPSRTDTKYFHDFIYQRSEIRFIRGRLRFGGHTEPAPFPSMAVIFRGAYVKEYEAKHKPIGEKHIDDRQMTWNEYESEVKE